MRLLALKFLLRNLEISLPRLKSISLVSLVERLIKRGNFVYRLVPRSLSKSEAALSQISKAS